MTTLSLITIPIRNNIASAPFDLGVYISNIVGATLIAAALAAFVFMIWGGILWITASGDKGKVEIAREKITGAIIGLGVVAVSWSIFLVLDSFFGLGMAGGQSTTSPYNYPSNPGSPSSPANPQAVCIYPVSRCCDNMADSSCFCKNSAYAAITYGNCDAGGGQTGVRCACIRR